ncbi:Mitogen-activated protein kinase kinase kinase [Fagus crenata]
MIGTWILLRLGAGRLQIRKDEDFLQKGFDPIGFPGLMNVVFVGCNGGEGDEKYSGGEDIDNGYQEFEVENSESPLKEERLIYSLENLGMDGHGNERERERDFD